MLQLRKKQLLAELLERTGSNWLIRKLRPWKGLLVLNYHRIGVPDASGFDHDLWSATPSQFEQQLKFLKSNFDVIAPRDLTGALNDSAARSVLITFDDGYRDNYEIAFPLLRAANLSAIFFVTTGFVDQPHVPWWDEISWMCHQTQASIVELPDLLRRPVNLTDTQDAVARLTYVYKRLRFSETAPFLDRLAEQLNTGRVPQELGRDLWMTWDMIREMHSAGMGIGGHSVTHPLLTSLSREQQDRELANCRTRLEDTLQEDILTFSYPVGRRFAVNAETMEAVRRHGFKYGFSHYGGFWEPETRTVYDIPRVPVERFMTKALFRCVTCLPKVFSEQT